MRETGRYIERERERGGGGKTVIVLTILIPINIGDYTKVFTVEWMK